MSDKYINNKRERSDSQSLIITLGKLESTFFYLEDSFQERSKIKIHFDDFSNLQNKKEISEDNSLNNNNLNNILNNNSNVLIEETVPQLAYKIENTIKQPLILPSCTSWFDLDMIHEIEYKSLPEFFCQKFPSKTKDVYKEYRNYIINLYRENPSSYLTSTSKKFFKNFFKFLFFFFFFYYFF